jgi:DNA repair photolyase
MLIGITETCDAALHFNERWLTQQPVDGFVFITKAPQLLPASLPDNCIIHCTITGYGSSKLEPGVAPPHVTIPAYKQLVSKYGSERVVLRIDPIIAEQPFTSQSLFVAKHAISRVRVSFFDLYPHVAARWKQRQLPVLKQTTFHAPLQARLSIYNSLTEILGFAPEVCAEPDLPCTGCLSERDLLAMQLDVVVAAKSSQRPLCNCMAIKKQLEPFGRKCTHNCAYCYCK